MESNSLIDQSLYELASFHDMVTQTVGGVASDVKIKDLMIWLQHPTKYRNKLIQLSKYFYNKDGVVTDAYDLFNVLPVLSYSILWENMSKNGYLKNKKVIDQFIKDIKLKKLVRDTIFTVIEEGTCVWYNRKNKYVQFLDNEQIEINYMVNGKWQVLFDLKSLDKFKLNSGLVDQINAAPEEVTLTEYNAYKKDSKKRYIPLNIDKTQVFKLRGSRNEPHGLPYCIPALASIIHRDLLEKTEKALADRIINQIILQKIGTMPSPDGKLGLPVPKPTVSDYHNNLKKLLQKKYDSNSTDNASTAPLTIPSFITVEELKINMTTFPKEVWERIDRDIHKKLGISTAINSGGGTGQSFGSASVNVEKLFAIIFYIVEDVEQAVNEFLSLLVSNDNFNPQIRFSRTTILDKDSAFKNAESLYLKGRGSLKDYVEAAGYAFDHWLAQVKYENEVLKLDKILPVHSTSFTQSGDGEGGRPPSKTPNDNTTKSKGNNGNGTPSPSD